MDNFLLEYRDPLFGILIFLILVFIVSFFSYWWAYYKKKEQESEIARFFSKFEENADEEILNIQNEKDTKKAFLLLATAYEKSGDFEKAIAIYLNLSKTCKKIEDKQLLLKKLGFIYFKIGFLAKSKEIFLEVLKFFPRDKEALKYLMVIYEKLQQYQRALEVLESLEESGAEEIESYYLKALTLVKGFTTNYDELIDIYKKEPSLVRLIFEYLFKNSPKTAWENLRKEDFVKIGDILWSLPKDKIDFDRVKKDRFLSDLYSAKKYIDISKESKIFEFDVLINLKKDIATLDFEYFCVKCKNIFPIPFYRCPNCLTPKGAYAEFILTKKRDVNEENISI